MVASGVKVIEYTDFSPNVTGLVTETSLIMRFVVVATNEVSIEPSSTV